MSGDDENEGGGRLFQFPRVVLPSSFDAPGKGSPDAEDGADGGAVPGAWPRLPAVDDMRVPFAFSMPGIPDPGPEPPDTADADADAGDGALALPQPEDPANPTVKETLAIAVALVTALGAAAAHGMWHRARHRAALADQARATADKTNQKAAASRGGSKGNAGPESSLLRSLGSSGKKTRGSTGGKHRPPRDAHSGSHQGPGRDKKGPSGRKPPKADRDGKARWKDGGKQKRRKRGGKGGLGSDGACVQTPKPKKAPKPPKSPAKGPKKLRWQAPKRRKNGSKDPKGWTSGRPGGKGTPKPPKGPKRGPGKMTWKAPKRKPGLGGDKAIEQRKRWARTPFAPDHKSRKNSKRRGRRWEGLLTWESPALKRWRDGHTTAGAGGTRRGGRGSWTRRKPSRGGRKLWGRRMRGGTGQATPRSGFAGFQWSSSTSGSAGAAAPPPPPRFGWGMRPPPGADRRTWYRVEWIKTSPRERWDRPTGRPALPPASDSDSEPAGQQPPPQTGADVKAGASHVNVPAPRMGGAIPLHGAQFRDAELTIRDVVEAGEETAQEILAGADEAKQSAAMCETLAARLEALYAELCELEVPGILIPNVAVLLDKAQDIRGKALAIADGLPLASEAMRVASANAAVRHQPTADMTRDMGHIKPAERPYHEE